MVKEEVTNEEDTKRIERIPVYFTNFFGLFHTTEIVGFSFMPYPKFRCLFVQNHAANRTLGITSPFTLHNYDRIRMCCLPIIINGAKTLREIVKKILDNDYRGAHQDTPLEYASLSKTALEERMEKLGLNEEDRLWLMFLLTLSFADE